MGLVVSGRAKSHKKKT